MKIEKILSKSCCGGISLTFKIDQSISTKIIESLVNNGFKELKHFTEVGILYVENSIIIITGPIGSNKLQIRCKKKDCDNDIYNLEKLFQQI